MGLISPPSPTPVAQAAVCSKEVIILLFICCLSLLFHCMFFPFCFGPRFVVWFLVSLPHGKVTKTQLNSTNKSQEVSPFTAGDHKAAMNRRKSMRNTTTKKQQHTNDPQKRTALERSVKIFYRMAVTGFTLSSNVDQDT